MASETIKFGSTGTATDRDVARAKLRAATEAEFPALVRQVANAIQRLPGRRTRGDVDDQAAEAVGEAVKRVLDNPGNYNPDYSAFAWIVGVARRVAQEGARVHGPRARRAELTDEEWQAIEDGRVDGQARASDLLDLRAILALLDPADRDALEFGRIRGLTGMELAKALGVATESAALARVHRARQKAKAVARRGVEEVNP